MYIGISAAGVFRSDDGGETWEPKNKGDGRRLHAGRPVPRGRPVRPQAAAPPGQDGPPLAAEPLRRLPHRRPRRELGAARGQRAAERLRLPDRARPPGAGRRLRHPGGLGRGSRPRSAAGTASPPDGRLGVYRTEDGGESWELATNGLPERAWVEVLREGMAVGPARPGRHLLRHEERLGLRLARRRATSGSRRRGYLPAILSVEVARVA